MTMAVPVRVLRPDDLPRSCRTASGEPLSWPTADDTTNTGVQLGESTSIGSSVDPSFGKVIWNAYKFSSKAILVPYELIQDSVFNLPAVLGSMLGERLGRITNTKFTTGSGASTAKGIVTCATSFSAATTAVGADDLIGLQHSVDPAYRMGASFMMHDSIILAIRKLKDGQGQYLWQSGLRDGAPDRILGAGITINQDMDSTTTSGKKSILYGQLSAYKIRTVGEIRLYRLEERYRDTDQDGFVAFTREDGNLLTAGTAPIKYLAH
jgi:HK97 family phage major capsid protein